MIPKIPFGSTGHQSTRTLFGAAAMGGMSQDRADRTMELLLERGVNHLDTAASYGDSELRLGPWMREHRDQFFLATKTHKRTYQEAKDSLHRSLERLQTDSVDLLQFHNLALDEELEVVFGPGGALEAAVEAKEQGLVRFLGVTGHGTRIAEMHLKSLERYAFDSVLLPYNYSMMQEDRYRSEFEQLIELCRERGVAVQTIKSIARRRWKNPEDRRFSWYEPIRDPEDLRRAVHWVLRRDGFFLNTSSDATLLPAVLDAATEAPEVTDEEMAAIVARAEIEPLFVRGVSDVV